MSSKSRLIEESKAQDLVNAPSTAFTMSSDHWKLLYLISLYARQPQNDHCKQTWIRKNALIVLIYEGAIQETFSYDYAPAVMYLASRHYWVNVSQEGVCALDDLSEMGFINILKLSSNDSSSITAYQVSRRGSEKLETMHEELKKTVDNLVMVDADKLMQVMWVGDRFQLFYVDDQNCKVIVRDSLATECEDVSYSSSPFLPSCLFHRDMPLTKQRPSRTSIVAESDDAKQVAAVGGDNIRDELEEFVHLYGVKLLMGEWLPFGENQILSLNDKLGSAERIQGGLLTAVQDNKPDDVIFECNPGLTSVRIIDYDYFNFIAFHAEIHFPEQDGIVQHENFGMFVNSEGSVTYGLRFDSVLDRKGMEVSLDHLARIMMDIRQDSSQIMDSLISSLQRNLLDVVFHNNRPKFSIILAEDIQPRKQAQEYLDSTDFDNELKQVIGDTQYASQSDSENSPIIVIGKTGMLIVGAKLEVFEPYLITYLSLMSRSIFLQCFYRRTLSIHESLKGMREMLRNHDSDPNSLTRIRAFHSDTEKKVILLQEILSFMTEGLEVFSIPEIFVDRSWALHHLSETFNLDKLLLSLKRRSKDMSKNIESAYHELKSIQTGINVITDSRMYRLQTEIRQNTKNLEDVFRSNERASTSLELLQVILAGTLAFEILDRLTGEWSVVEQPWARNWIVEPFIETPGVWFLLNMVLWMLIGFGLVKFMKSLSQHSSNVITMRIVVDRPIVLEKLRLFLSKKEVMEESCEYRNNSDDDNTKSMTCKVHYSDQLPSVQMYAVKTRSVELRTLDIDIEIQYDAINGFLLQLAITAFKIADYRINQPSIWQNIMQDFEDNKVFVSNESGIKEFPVN